MATATSTDIDSSVRFLESLIGRDALKRVGVQFWDGTRWPDEQPREATLALQHAGALREMFGAGTEKGLAEAFLHGAFDIEGNIESAFELADVLRQRGDAGWFATLRTFYRWQQLPGKRDDNGSARAFANGRAEHSLERDQQAVSFHYDVSNDFYRLWLDDRMIYSCGYFEHEEASLNQAQEAKLSLLCRKLRLGAGQRLLDIGCGWGGLAIFAAQHFGAHVTGITLSRQQAELATERVRAAGLERVVTIELRDYRELRGEEEFDAIVSVGMAEHVGRKNLASYFAIARRLLRPGGVFLNHAIGEGVRPLTRVGPSFMEEYVFPDSDIPPIPLVVQAAETAGLEVRDVENLREHYALTLRRWVQRLESAHVQARAFVNEATFRVWRLYMAGSAYGFARGQLAVYQTLLSKPDHEGHSRLPLTRDDWFRAVE